MNELEEKFFKAFGIEPKTLDYPDNFEYYPEITDHILLELICFLADAFVGEYCVPDVDYNNLKWHILNDCIQNDEKGQLKDLIQSLFTEGE